MSKNVFEQIAEGLNEALAVVHGKAEPYRLHVSSEIDDTVAPPLTEKCKKAANPSASN